MSPIGSEPSLGLCINDEVTKGEYDMIAIADQAHDWRRRWLVRDWVAPLLSCADRPVLVAKPFDGVSDGSEDGHIWGISNQARISFTTTEALRSRINKSAA